MKFLNMGTKKLSLKNILKEAINNGFLVPGLKTVIINLENSKIEVIHAFVILSESVISFKTLIPFHKKHNFFMLLNKKKNSSFSDISTPIKVCLLIHSRCNIQSWVCHNF